MFSHPESILSRRIVIRNPAAAAGTQLAATARQPGSRVTCRRSDLALRRRASNLLRAVLPVLTPDLGN